MHVEAAARGGRATLEAPPQEPLRARQQHAEASGSGPHAPQPEGGQEGEQGRSGYFLFNHFVRYGGR